MPFDISVCYLNYQCVHGARRPRPGPQGYPNPAGFVPHGTMTVHCLVSLFILYIYFVFFFCSNIYYKCPLNLFVLYVRLNPTLERPTLVQFLAVSCIWKLSPSIHQVTYQLRPNHAKIFAWLCGSVHVSSNRVCLKMFETKNTVTERVTP